MRETQLKPNRGTDLTTGITGITGQSRIFPVIPVIPVVSYNDGAAAGE
jgi:hypothetical protein